MKPWQLMILGFMFVCLILLYFFNQKPLTQEASKVFSTPFPELKQQQPDSIEVFSRSDNQKRLFLRLTKSGWQVLFKEKEESFWAPARDRKARKLLSDLSDLSGQLRSSSKKYLGDFGLGKGQGLEISLKKDGKEVARIIVGKKGPVWGSCFVKRADSDRVFLATKDLLADFDIWSTQNKGAVEIRPWVNLSVIAKTPVDIKECSLESEKTGWSLKKAETKGSNGRNEMWSFVFKGQKRNLTDQEAEKILNGIFPLYAQDVVPSKAFHESRRTERFVYKGHDEKTRFFILGSCEKGKDGVCLVKDDRGYVFRIEGSKMKRIRNPLAALEKRRKEKSGKKMRNG